MAATVMQLVVVTPEGRKTLTEVTDLVAPGVLGELDILPGHVPILTVLDVGELRYVGAGGDTVRMAVNGGFLEVDKDRLVVITETAEIARDIDVERARLALDRARERLEQQEGGSTAFELAQRAVKRARNRLRVAGAEIPK